MPALYICEAAHRAHEAYLAATFHITRFCRQRQAAKAFTTPSYDLTYSKSQGSAADLRHTLALAETACSAHQHEGTAATAEHLMLAGLKAVATPLRTSRHHSSVVPVTRSGCPLAPISCGRQHGHGHSRCARRQRVHMPIESNTVDGRIAHCGRGSTKVRQTAVKLM